MSLFTEMLMSDDIRNIQEKIKQNISKANNEIESAFAAIIEDTPDIPIFKDNDFYAHRIISYNPNNKLISESFRDIKKSVDEISGIIKRYTNEIKDSPNKEDSWVILGNCYLMMGDFPNAYTSYMHVLRINKNIENTYFWYCCGICYQHFRYNEEASRCFNTVLNLDPNFKQINDLKFRLALSYRTLFKYQESIDLFSSLFDNPPLKLHKDDINYHLAIAYQCFGKAESANDIYMKLYKKYPNNEIIIQQYLWFLSLQSNQQSLSIADTIIKKLTKEQLINPNVILSIAKIALKQQNFEEAFDKYKKCSNYHKHSPIFWNSLGILYCNINQFEDAKIAFQNAISNKSDVIEPWVNLGFLYEKMGDYDSAKKIYETGLMQCPTNNKLLQDRIKNNINKNIRSSFVEIDETRYMGQTGDTINNDIYSIPFIPSEQFGVKNDITNLLLNLTTQYKSIFSA